MGNQPFKSDYNFQNNLSQDDWYQMEGYRKTIYTNRHSGDQFNLLTLNLQGSKIQEYKNRQRYSFSGTPKVIILGISQLSLNILVEDASHSIHKLLSEKKKCKITLLTLLQNILKVYDNLRKKYGCFYPTESMIRVNNKYKILIWCNENYEINYPNYPLPKLQGQQTMIEQILKIFNRYLDRRLQARKFQQILSQIQYSLNRQLSYQTNYIPMLNNPEYRQTTSKKTLKMYKNYQDCKNPFILSNQQNSYYQIIQGNSNFFKDQFGNGIFPKNQIIHSKLLKLPQENKYINSNFSNTSIRLTQNNCFLRSSPISVMKSDSINTAVQTQQIKQKKTKDIMVLYPVRDSSSSGNQFRKGDIHNVINPRVSSNRHSTEQDQNVSKKLTLQKCESKQSSTSRRAHQTINLSCLSISKTQKNILGDLISPTQEKYSRQQHQMNDSMQLQSPLRRQIKNQFDMIFS